MKFDFLSKPDAVIKRIAYLLIVIVLICNLGFGLWEKIQLSFALGSYKNKFLSKQIEHSLLQDNIDKAQSDKSYIENLAKDYYNMVNSNDILYIKSK